MKIVKYPSEILLKKCDPISRVNAEILTLAGEMLFTMDQNNGIGLAAPQIGKLIQLFVMDTRKNTSDGLLEFFINPVITSKESNYAIEEGCLSFPKTKTVTVNRANTIVVEYTNLKNDRVTKELTGLNAIVAQHEIDHLNGITFVEYEKSKV